MYKKPLLLRTCRLTNFPFCLLQALTKSTRPDDASEDYILVEDTTRWLRDASGERTPAQQMAPRVLDPSERLCQRASQSAKYFLCRKSEVKSYTSKKLDLVDKVEPQV